MSPYKSLAILQMLLLVTMLWLDKWSLTAVDKWSLIAVDKQSLIAADKQLLTAADKQSLSRQRMRAPYLHDYPNHSPGERLWHVTRQTFDGSWQVAMDSSHHLGKQPLASSLTSDKVAPDKHP
jgi:hypothetical protein